MCRSPQRLPDVAFRKSYRARRGTIIVLTALLLMLMLAFVAFGVDTGCLVLARTQLQCSADAAALAAANELLEQKMRSALPATYNPDEDLIHQVASEFAGHNKVIGATDRTFNLPQRDVIVGRLNDPTDPNEGLKHSLPSKRNAVQVRVSCTDTVNGRVKTHFAPLMGVSEVAITAQATAAFRQNFAGFRTPQGTNEKLPILPFTLDERTWKRTTEGLGEDDWRWNIDTERAEPGRDGVPEIRLYPEKTGSGGNWGTVDIGSDNSDTSTLQRQIAEGVSAKDLEFHGGELKLTNGKLTLSADPGLRAGAIESELQSIIGKTRIIPLFESVSGGGNPGEYTIVGFVGVRILLVELTTSDKAVVIQPAPVVIRGGIPAEPGEPGSEGIYSPVSLVR